MRLPKALASTLLLAVASGVLACSDDGPPQYPLRIVMAEIEINRQDLGKALLREDGVEPARECVREIRTWLADPSTDRYLTRGDILGTRADFDVHHAAILAILDGIDASLAAGDMQAARDAYPKLEAGCDACHRIFRPDLSPR